MDRETVILGGGPSTCQSHMPNVEMSSAVPAIWLHQDKMRCPRDGRGIQGHPTRCGELLARWRGTWASLPPLPSKQPPLQVVMCLLELHCQQHEPIRDWATGAVAVETHARLWTNRGFFVRDTRAGPTSSSCSGAMEILKRSIMITTTACFNKGLESNFVLMLLTS